MDSLLTCTTPTRQTLLYWGWQRRMCLPHLPPFHIYKKYVLVCGFQKVTWIMYLNSIQSEDSWIYSGGEVNLSLLFSFRQGIGLVLFASELFTIYFTISAQAILFSPPSGKIWRSDTIFFPPCSSRSIYSVEPVPWTPPAHNPNNCGGVATPTLYILCVSVCVSRQSI